MRSNRPLVELLSGSRDLSQVIRKQSRSPIEFLDIDQVWGVIEANLRIDPVGGGVEEVVIEIDYVAVMPASALDAYMSIESYSTSCPIARKGVYQLVHLLVGEEEAVVAVVAVVVVVVVERQHQQQGVHALLLALPGVYASLA